jgi:hypothetical protein
MIGVKFDERRPIEMPVDGSLIKWTREDGESLYVSLNAATMPYGSRFGSRTNTMP